MYMRRIIDLAETEQLNELVPSKQFTDKLKDSLVGNRGDEGIIASFVNDLAKLGFVLLGRGAYGTVFTHPGLDYCIKIFTGDNSYKDFVHYSQKHASDIHLPRFRGKITRVTKGTYFIRMEKLNPSSDAAKKVVQLVKRYTGASTSLERLNQQYKDQLQSDSVIRAFERNEGVVNTLRDLERMRILNPNLIWDLHSENYMMRGDTIVITDPFQDDIPGLTSSDFKPS